MVTSHSLLSLFKSFLQIFCISFLLIPQTFCLDFKGSRSSIFDSHASYRVGLPFIGMDYFLSSRNNQELTYIGVQGNFFIDIEKEGLVPYIDLGAGYRCKLTQEIAYYSSFRFNV